MGVAARMAVLAALAAAGQRLMSARPTAFTNARLVDPASGYDGPGAVIVTEGVIADVAQGAIPASCPRRAR
jgi:predicted amidohydrolase